MQIIRRPSDRVAQICAEGKVNKTSGYRLFDFLISEKLDNGTLALNALTGELVFFNEKEEQRLSRLPCDYADWMDELIRKRFLVSSDSDDRAMVDNLRRILRIQEAAKSISGYTILTTTDCNARCFYCYERGIKHEDMSDLTADALVDFIAANRGSQAIRLNWFGGEPLVGMRQIDRICSALRARDIPYTSKMTSNGYLFDEALVKKAADEWQLKHIQITLDGTEEVYNRTKAYLDPVDNPYRRVLDNIGLLLKAGIETELRLNLGPHNAEDLSTLIDEIAAEFKDKSKLKVYTHLLFDNCGVNPIHFDNNELAELRRKEFELHKKLCSYVPFPYWGELPHMKAIHCAIDTSSLVVFPNGQFGKCQHFSGSHFVGNVYDGITDPAEISLLRERELQPECISCPLYPKCDKPKYCEIDNLCRPIERSFKIEAVINTMRLYYEDLLKAQAASESGRLE